MGVSAYFNYHDANAPIEERLVLLPDLSEDEWQRLLAHMVQRQFDAGETVIAAGDTGRALYIVGQGVLEVLRPGEAPIMVHPGGVIGEMAFFDGQPRSADVRARTACTLFDLTRERFDVLAAHEPVLARRLLFELGRVLTYRLRRAQAGDAA